MLSASQQTCLEDIVRSVSPDLHIEAATLGTDQTLELVLCREFVCFRPLVIDSQEVDIPAALAGKAEAREAFKVRLQSALQGLL